MNPRLPERVSAAAAVVATIALCAGCGLPAPGGSREIAPGDVPYELLSPSPQAKPTATVDGPRIETASVFLLDAQDRLVDVPLTVEAAGVQSVADQVLADLEDGPTEQQRDTGLSSPLGTGVELDLVRVDGSTAKVEVAQALRDPAADRLPLVVGQIVLSLTSIDGVDAVVLLRDGQPVETPLPGGARTTDPLRASDYASLVTTVPATASP